MDYGFISPHQMTYALNSEGYDAARVAGDIPGAVEVLSSVQNVDPYYLTVGQSELPELVKNPDNYMGRDNYGVEMTQAQKAEALMLTPETAKDASLQQVLYRTNDLAVMTPEAKGFVENQDWIALRSSAIGQLGNGLSNGESQVITKKLVVDDFELCLSKTVDGVVIEQGTAKSVTDEFCKNMNASNMVATVVQNSSPVVNAEGYIPVQSHDLSM